MLNTSALANISISFTVSLLVTFGVIPVVAGYMKRHGIVGRDVHKLSKPEIPEMCGLAVMIGLVVGQVVSVIVFPSVIRVAGAFIGTVIIAGGIGMFDDLHPLSGRIKPVLTAIASLPILVLGTYSPFIVVPFVGAVSMTTVYPFIVPVAIAVTSNAVNMMDVMNGAMPGTISIISLTATVILFASGQYQAAALAAGLLAAMLALYYFNRFPARVFSGDTGSLTVGAALGAVAIMGKIEAVMIVSLLPHIMNSFYGLSSVGGLRERREIHQRPTRLLDNGLLDASTEVGAPVTLTRILLAAGPLSERQIVRLLMSLTAVSCTLAVITYLIMVVH